MWDASEGTGKPDETLIGAVGCIRDMICVLASLGRKNHVS